MSVKIKHLQYKMVQEFFLHIGGIKGQQAKATYLNCAEGVSFDVLGHFCTQYAILLFVLNYLFFMEVPSSLHCFVLQEHSCGNIVSSETLAYRR